MSKIGDRLAAEGLFESRYDGIEKPYKKGKRVQPVVQLDLDGNFIQDFGSIVQAAQATGVHKSDISKVCREVRKTAGGFVWVYADIWYEENE